MSTIDVKDAGGSTVAIEKPLAPGRVAAISSRPVALSNEDKTALDAVATQATLAAVLAKLLAAPATEAKQDTGNTALGTLHTDLTGGAAITKDGGPSWTTVWGVASVPFTSADQHSGVASVTDAPTSGQKLVIDDLIISVDTAMSVTLKCETSGAVIFGPIYMPANSVIQITPRGKGKKLATADKKLQVITSAAGNVTVDAGYHSEA